MNLKTTSALNLFTSRHFFIVLVLILSFSGFGQNVISQSQKNTISKPVSENSPLEAMKGKKEDISKRDAFSKHYVNEDGSYTALIGSGPIHYKKKGLFYDISHQITSRGNDAVYPYANVTNLFESYFGRTAHQGVKNVTPEGEIKEFLNTQMYWEVNGQAVNKQNSADVPVTVKDDKAYYNNLFGNISAEFIVKSGQRKLNYIIPNRQSLGAIPSNADYLVFTEKIQLSGNFSIVNEYKQKKYNKLKKEYQTIPGIFIIDGNKNVIYNYSAPQIVENYNSDEMGLSAQMMPEISFEERDGYVIFYTKIKAKWITAHTRTFPIAIDPTATAYPFTASFSSGQTYSTSGASGDIAAGYSGGWYRGWATFNLTSLPSLSGVTAATVSLYIGNKGGTMGTTGTTNINIGHTSFDLSRLVWLNNYATLYNAITATTNSLAAYNYIPNVNVATWATVNLKPNTSTVVLEEIEKKSGNDMAFFPVSFSPSWGTGTTTRFYVIAGYTATNKPYLTITYNEVDKYKHAAYMYANAADIGDVGYVQIGNVSIGSINNTTTITNYAANASTIYKNTPTGYNKYNLSTNVEVGSTYTLNSTYRDLAGVNYNSGKIAAWVDWNEDGDFADANEYIGISANSTSGNQVMSFSITVPSGTSAGTKRLRLRSALFDETVTSSSYDTTLEYGETEDYNLAVLAPTNSTLTVSNAHTGASYANGVHTITNNTSVTATAGTRAGYIVTGWTGTGSVPATGTTGSSTFNITQNSTISWNWACTAAITSVTNGSGCADITLTAVGAAGTTTYNWYTASTGGSPVHTASTGTWVVSGLTSETTYYVAANNGTCESPRVAVTATPTPTTAAVFSQDVSICVAGSATLSAETNNDALYTVNWYDVPNGGSPLHTGFTYTPTITQTTTFYVAAVDGACESERITVVVTLNAKTWNGSQSTAWNDSANWTPAGVPTSEHCVVIPQTANSPIIANGTEANARSLTLQENSSLLVQSGGSITVVQSVVLAENAGQTVANLTLENNAYLRQTQNVSTNNNVGKITVHRSSTPMFRTEATGWSSPVENQKLFDFAVGTLSNRIYEYDETSNTFVNTNITANSIFEGGKGYSIRSPNTYPNYTAINTPTPVTFNGVFYGRPNNGDVGINITTNNLGFNYVGNPYPSPLDAYALIDDNQTIDALYFWTHEAPPINGVYAANNYASFNGTGGTESAAGGEEPDGIIQVGQGFVVRTASPTLLQFTNGLRTSTSNGQFFKNGVAGEKHRMWLNLSDSQTNFNQILIGYVSNATMDRDHQIDAKMFSYSGSSIYSLINSEKFVIQGRSLPFDANDVVPVGFRATEAGTYTIAIDHVDGLFTDGQTIYLNDLLLNSSHNLSQSAYSFLSDVGTFNDRFEIVYNNALSVSNPELNNNNWIVYKKDNTITIKSNGFNLEKVEIYDLTGRLLVSKRNINSETFSCPDNFAQQVLLVKVNDTLVKKVL